MKRFWTIWLVVVGCVGQLTAQTTAALSEDDITEIELLAYQKIAVELQRLYNQLTNENTGSFAAKKLMLDSYLPSKKQVFYGDGVVIEDDLMPNKKGPDMLIDRYLGDMMLYYQKTKTASVSLENVEVKNIEARSNGFFVNVVFRCNFKGFRMKSKQVIPYTPTNRIAGLRVEKNNKRWVVLISSIGFLTNPKPI